MSERSSLLSLAIPMSRTMPPTDQADRLRGLVRNASVQETMPLGRIVAVCSGKGGVGKSVVALNLAIALAQRGQSVALIEADLECGSLALLCGHSHRWNLSHVVRGEKRLASALQTGPAGLKLLTGARGGVDFDRLPAGAIESLATAVRALAAEFDLLFLDLPTGYGAMTRQLAARADELLVIATPEPAAISGAYAAIKLLRGDHEVTLITNMAARVEDATRVSQSLASTAKKFLDVTVDDAGSIPRDPAVMRSVFTRSPYVVSEPRSPAARSTAFLAEELLTRLSARSGVPLAAGSPTAAAA